MPPPTIREKVANLFARAERAATPGTRSRLLLAATKLLGKADGEDELDRRNKKTTRP